MMKVVLYPAITLDGFIAKTDGDSDWVTDGDLFEEKAQELGCVIVGKSTFDQFRGEIFPIENTVTYVVTHSKISDVDDIHYVQGTAQYILDRIERDGHKNVLNAGGGEVNGLFASEGLLDEIIVDIYPLAFGEGIKLFGSYSIDLKLELLSSNQLKDGIIQNHYKVIKD